MNRNKMIITIALSIVNIILGIIFMVVIFTMQGFYLLLLGLVYIIFGVSILIGRHSTKLLFWGIMPVTLLFSFNIIMTGIVKNMPEYFRTPLGIGILMILPFWLAIIGDFYLCKCNRRRKHV